MNPSSRLAQTSGLATHLSFWGVYMASRTSFREEAEYTLEHGSVPSRYAPSAFMASLNNSLLECRGDILLMSSIHSEGSVSFGFGRKPVY